MKEEQCKLEAPRAMPSSPPTRAEDKVTRVAERIVTKVIEKEVEVDRKPLTPAEARSLVEEVVEGLDCDDVNPVKEGSRQTGLIFTTKTDKGRRRQNVNVVWDTTDEDGTETMVLYSVCCEAKEEYYETALRWNQNIASGSICLTDIKGRPSFILLQHISLDRATREAVHAAIKSLADRADQIEKVLTGAEDIR